jgi:hypothetical protein
MSLHEHVDWSGYTNRLARTFGRRFGDHAARIDRPATEVEAFPSRTSCRNYLVGPTAML